MMNLTDILSQPEGFTPPGIKVKVLRVFDHKSGETDKGPWSFQDVEVEDASGKGRLKLKNCDALPSEKAGKELILTANQSKQHGLTGLKVAHEEYQGKKYDKLIVTGSAQWTWEGNGNGTAKPATSQPAPVSNGHTAGFTAHLLACADTAIAVAEKLGIVSDEARQACFATVCIDAQRRGVVLDTAENGNASPTATEAQERATPEQRKAIGSLCKSLEIPSAKAILADVGCVDPEQLTSEQAGKVIELLQKQENEIPF